MEATGKCSEAKTLNFSITPIIGILNMGGPISVFRSAETTS